MIFVLLLLLLLSLVVALAEAEAPRLIARDDSALASIRKRHPDVPLVGLLFDERDHASVDHLLKARAESHHFVLVGVHVPSVREFANWTHPQRIPLNAAARAFDSRRLAEVVPLNSVTQLHHREHAVVLVTHRAEEDYVKAKFGHISDDYPEFHPFHIHGNTQERYAKIILQSLPHDSRKHSLFFFHDGRIACTTSFWHSKDMRDRYERCAEEKYRRLRQSLPLGVL